MQFRVETRRHVISYTVMITAIATAAPVLVVVGLLVLASAPLPVILGGFLISFLIPMLIAPPVSYFALSTMRALNQTIQRVDIHVRLDGLTGVLNRTHFLDNMRGREASGVLMIVDADHFKAVNDTFGHAAGDVALQALAATISDCVGPKMLVGRLGGEEFAVFMPATTAQDGLAKAQYICETVKMLDILADGSSIKMTVSIGCTLHESHFTIGHSLKQADKQLYLAKAEGRNCVRFEGIDVSKLNSEIVEWPEKIRA